MSFLRFIFSKTFLKNILLAAGLILVLALSTIFFLKFYTRHGESLTVPEIKGLSYEEAKVILERKGLRYVIRDSVYFEDMKKNSITEQDPLADSKVKEGRIIYLTINSSIPPKVKMPNLVDVSYRQAQVILESMGLKMGEVIFRPGMVENVVIEQRYNGRKIPVDELVDKGSKIDLVVESGVEDTQVDIPDLTGMTRDEAMFLLQANNLSLGSVIFSAGIDSLNAKVYKQIPESLEGQTMKQGEAIDIFLK